MMTNEDDEGRAMAAGGAHLLWLVDQQAAGMELKLLGFHHHVNELCTRGCWLH